MGIALEADRKERAIERWLRCESKKAVGELFTHADEIRRQHVGEEVYLRGLIEVSNYCRRACLYCGLNINNRKQARYRMTSEEIMRSVDHAVKLGFETVVLQSGEDGSLTTELVADMVRRIKDEYDIAVTLSLGERTRSDLEVWKEAGADRYLLRFETSDEGLLRAIHPPLAGVLGRFEMLGALREIGYEVGSGVMVGIPGQTYKTLAHDIALFEELSLDMIGVGPYLAHPDTLLGQAASLEFEDQVPANVIMTCKVIALARILCPDANIPATTALGVADSQQGRMHALQCGANVVMPNCTLPKYRDLYEIYPGKKDISEASATVQELYEQLKFLDRKVGTGVGTSPAYEHKNILFGS